MTTNVGTIDRVIRVIVGFFLLGLAFTTLAGGLKVLAVVVGVVLWVTAAIGFCPLYRLLGINTCAVKK